MKHFSEYHCGSPLAEIKAENIPPYKKMKNHNIKWILIFALLCLLCMAVWIVRSRNTADYKIAEIKQNGELIKKLDLSLVDEPFEFDISDGNGGANTIRIEKGRIAVINANCPDKICVHQGFISNGSVPIVCLPHKLTITVTGDSEEYDAIAGGN
ncbi:MAG: NusG domain II-containing protein [Candidatus Ornithomonoglobus sp.]